MPRQTSPTKLRLQEWNFKRMPFPVVPFVDPFNSDPLCNGSVFAADLRSKEIKQIREHILQIGFPDMVKPWTWIWAKKALGANVGMGKTALLTYIADQINYDYGKRFFGHAAHWLVVYVRVPARAKSVDEIAALALASMCSTARGLSVEQLLLARLRHKVIALGLVGNEHFVPQSAQQRSFANDQWVAAHGIDMEKLKSAIDAYLSRLGVLPEIAQAISAGSLAQYFAKLNGAASIHSPTAKFVNKSMSLFLNDIAIVVKAAGIAHLTVFLDDFYHLVRRTPQPKRPQLAGELRDISVDGNYQSIDQHLYNWVAVMHTVTAPKFADAWEQRDMHVVAPLDRNKDPNPVVLEAFSKVEARALLLTYLRYQRPRSITDQEALFPFSDDALDRIADIVTQQNMGATTQCEPRRLLTAAFSVTLAALHHEPDPAPINQAFVDYSLQGVPLPELQNDEDVETGEESLPLTQPCPCTCHDDEDGEVFDVVALVAMDGAGADGEAPAGYRCIACNLPVSNVPHGVTP
jgi:hypothetical protein